LAGVSPEGESSFCLGEFVAVAANVQRLCSYLMAGKRPGLSCLDLGLRWMSDHAAENAARNYTNDSVVSGGRPIRVHTKPWADYSTTAVPIEGPHRVLYLEGVSYPGAKNCPSIVTRCCTRVENSR
jgi:hypothetical protein